jgi:adenylate cyclase
MDRKLTAILYADIAGYSRLTGADEKGTHAALKDHLGALTGAIEHHGGRIVNTASDAVLAEFASVVTALECAVAAQREMAERDKDVPAPRKLQFRIGVNLGDVIVDGEEIYGNGVNVAARLETLADAGGICISGRVLEQVKGNIDLGYAYLGAQKVKNIETPVNAYKVLLDPEDAGKMIESRKPKAPKWPWSAAAAVAVAIVALAGVAEWMRPSTVELQPAAKEELAYPLPDIPSIAVLPFANLSGDPEQEYLAEGMTEDIITELSRRKALFVIARTSTLPYKNHPVPVAQVARELGVRYVLEGSIQRSGERLRVTAQLIDGLQGNHVWAERYDRDLKDLFAVQDDITQAVVSRLREEVIADLEKRLLERNPESFNEASDHVWRGQAHLHRAVNLVDKDENRKAEAFFTKTLELEPENAAAHLLLGWVHFFDWVYHWSPSREESFRKMREFAARRQSAT